ncbi:MAG: hypothetical protein JWN36_2749 [Microbacteriaceae bacterium]|nr:hypothetical protein [Microbacteriaceae bacterium]
MSLTRSTKAAIVVGAGALVAVMAFAAFIAYELGAFNAFRVNEAQQGFQQLDAGLRDHGARQVCDSGDPGYGPDNIQPWYSAQYEVARAGDIRAMVGAVADEAGYPLSTVALPENTPNALFPTYTYQAQHDGRVLIVTVTEGAAPKGRCPAGYRASGSSAVIDVDLAYPARDGTPAEPLTTPTPEPTSVTDWADRFGGRFDAVTVVSSGSQVVQLPAGATAGIVTMRHPSAGAFSVTSSTADGGPGPDLLVRTDGPYDGVAPFGLESAGGVRATALDVTAEGDWTLVIAPLSEAPFASFPVVGAGDTVLLRDGTSGQVRAHHPGGGLFEIRVLTANGPPAIPVFEPDGAFDGPVPLYGGYGVIVITATGDWTLGP